MTELKWFHDHGARLTLHWNEPLSKHTYYRIGGPADLLIQPAAPADLEVIHEGLQATGVPFVVLGMGSNILASDQGFRGVVVKTSKLNSTLEEAGDELRVGASVTVTSLLRQAGLRGWKGFERLAGIPGSIGGVVVMNAGTHLGEAKDLLLSAEMFSLKSGASRSISFTPESFSYRKNHFLVEGEVMVESRWRRDPGDPTEIQQTTGSVLQRRKASQPLEYPSCGSVFKNPPGRRAWEVIEQLGLRGHRIGNAQISEKHPNFIVNLGGAQASDVRQLIEKVKTQALDQLQVVMEEEVQWVGEPLA